MGRAQVRRVPAGRPTARNLDRTFVTAPAPFVYPTDPAMEHAQGDDTTRTFAYAGVASLLGALAVAVAARLTFPLPGAELPQSAQTLAVLLMGAALGLRRGVLAVGLYVLAGVLGLPVFADGASGLETVVGPSGGYLFGFGCAAAWVGSFADTKRLARPWWRALGVMLGAHGLILLFGGLGIAARVGAVQAWAVGVAPFLLGGAVKSLLAAMLVVAMTNATAPRQR